MNYIHPEIEITEIDEIIGTAYLNSPTEPIDPMKPELGGGSDF